MQIDSILAAAEVLAPWLHRTPVVTSGFYDRRTGAEVHFKCENLQRTGSFKARGAFHAVMTLSTDDAERGVCAASSGNHGQALACAAAARGIEATIVMPENSLPEKRAAVLEYGARVVDCPPGDAVRREVLAQVASESGAHVVDSHDDPRIIAGQGTATLELLDSVPDLDAILVPVGGGGLLSGTAIAAKAQARDIRVYGCEPRGADDAARSLSAGAWQPQEDARTVADGLRTSLGKRYCWPIIADKVDDIICVEEHAILSTLIRFWQRTKLLIEPSSAVAVAALDQCAFAGQRVGVVLSGGNYTPKV